MPNHCSRGLLGLRVRCSQGTPSRSRGHGYQGTLSTQTGGLLSQRARSLRRKARALRPDGPWETQAPRYLLGVHPPRPSGGWAPTAAASAGSECLLLPGVGAVEGGSRVVTQKAGMSSASFRMDSLGVDDGC